MIYGHGDDGYRYGLAFKANFSSNVWYEKTNDKLISHLQKQLPLIANYPTPNADELAAKIATYHQLETQNIVVTNGATEAFYIIATLFHGKKAAIAMPTFSEYEDACAINKINLSYYKRSDVNNTDFKEDLVFICNPNNPDGLSNTMSEIKELLIKFPDTTFVIDEAYINFTQQITSCIGLLEYFKNLIIVKSLTKLFTIPGLRLGYILCNPEIEKKLKQLKMPWTVNIMAIEAGKYIFDNYTTVSPDMTILLGYSKILQEQINALDHFTVIPSETNYFLVRLKTPEASTLKDYLAYTHKLLIRNASNFRNLDAHYIRIASQNPQKNKLLVNALKEWSIHL
ncbi:aminotransferase class I/II-fold pyridoxal phosphate-dependent enzyme [Aquimarina sp. RZ0]|uniref:aminotransferase class I/II-fold pyridoxal phosphate-dependent enzyme n=1 Tax=Aquimarina sp. RZ0 TaxID=2607730 RepID=UPI0011F1180C|nr:aminotransferase class I/II-fold pyridoxal phosphate-dependent enzyme [Aquimarina sp. RZ0]KAA1245180.1 aminotransferase class I/II-fold pyridoxal phosphate-dependent enzyme [Aquimarina sp. RZ0]